MAETPPPGGIKPGATGGEVPGEIAAEPDHGSPPQGVTRGGDDTRGPDDAHATSYATAEPPGDPGFDPARAAVRSSGLLAVEPPLTTSVPPAFITDLSRESIGGMFQQDLTFGKVELLTRGRQIQPPPKEPMHIQKWVLSVGEDGKVAATISDHPTQINHDRMAPFPLSRIIAAGRIWRDSEGRIIVNGNSKAFASGDEFVKRSGEPFYEVAETAGLIAARPLLEQLLGEEIHFDPHWNLALATGWAAQPDTEAAEAIRENRLDPKRLDGMKMSDGTTIRVLRDPSDFPDDPEVRRRWDRHYAVFEIKNKRIGYTGYVAIHRLTQIRSKSPLLDGKWYATGGTRMRPYPDEMAALKDAMELAQEMSFKSAGQGLEIAGSKCTIFAPGINPRPDGPDKVARKHILKSFAMAFEEIGRSLGGGVLTGQDMNISVEDAMWMHLYAPTSIIPYVAENFCRPPVGSTVVGLLAAMGAAIEKKFPEAPTFKDKVIAIQGVGNIGGLILKPLLVAGAKIIASDVDPNTLAALSSDAHLQKYVSSGHLRFILERKISAREFTGHIYDPLTAFPGLKSEMGVEHVDVFAPCAAGGVLNNVTIPILHSAGVRVVCGSANDASADKNRHPRMLRDHDMVYVPDYIANAGGLLGVDGHLGHEISDEAIDQRVRVRVRGLLDQAEAEGLTPQEVADRENRAFFEALPHAPLPVPPPPSMGGGVGEGGTPSLLSPSPLPSPAREEGEGHDPTRAQGKMVVGNLAVDVIPATSEELGRESGLETGNIMESKKSPRFQLLDPRPNHLRVAGMTFVGDDILKSRLRALAESRGLNDVTLFLSRLSENQIVRLVRAAGAWERVLERNGFRDAHETLRLAPPVSATDKFFLTAAALARSDRDVNRIASKSVRSFPGAPSIHPAFLVPAGSVGLATGRTLPVLR